MAGESDAAPRASTAHLSPTGKQVEGAPVEFSGLIMGQLPSPFLGSRPFDKDVLVV